MLSLLQGDNRLLSTTLYSFSLAEANKTNSEAVGGFTVVMGLCLCQGGNRTFQVL